MRLQLGSPVRCTDGPFGELADIVLAPATRRVTHLVVEPHHRHDQARVVPVELVHLDDGAVALAATVDEVKRLPRAEEFAYSRLGDVRPSDPEWDVGIETVLAMPSYVLPGVGAEPLFDDQHISTTYDRVPKGEVELRRQSPVVSADGHGLGHVDGFVVDGEDAITHLVLEHGHLWRRGRVTVPVSAVARVENDEVTLSLTKDEVAALRRREAA